jgi:hypothetical protein
VSYQYPDRISVEENGEVEVKPLHATLEVVIEGESSVFGNEAFKKSKELASFISKLETIKYSPENISLENISIQTSSGKLLKSSMAKFTLLLNKIKLELIPNILGIISSQKNIEILEMEYFFGNLENEKINLYKDLCLAAKNQGEVIGEAFGVSLLSVYSMTPKWTFPFNDAISQRYSNSGLRLSKSRGPSKRELEGLDFVANYKGKLSLSLKVDFRVGEFKLNSL